MPPEGVAALVAIDADVLVLTEYVPGPDHARVVADLQRAGYAATHISARVERQNQVLAATRATSRPGPWTAPDVRPQIPPNFLHVEVPDLDLQVVGLRIPMFVRGDTAGEHFYRDWLRDQAGTWGQRPTIVIGDLNTGPHRPRSWQWHSIASFEDEGWTVFTPDEGWSYVSKTGHTSRIDHALLSPGLACTAARYVTEVGGFELAGKHPPAPSDHAVLVVDAKVG